MNDPSHSLQKGVYAALTASAALATAMGGAVRVYDKVDPAAQYPFIRIGDDEVLGADTSCFPVWECFVTLHIFSQAAAPRPEVKSIADPMRAALVDTIALDDFQVDAAEFQSFRSFFETDGETAHGVMTIRYLVSASV